MNCLVCIEKNEGKNEYHKKCLVLLFGRRKVNPVLPFTKADMLRASHLEPVTHKMSISGVQIKLSVKLMKSLLLPVETEGEYILKPSPPEFPLIAENEHLSMSIGKLLGIDTPPLGLIRFKDGEMAYLTKRFDRNRNEKFRKEDMCQIFNIPREEKYSSNYEKIGLKIYEVTRDLICVRDFLKRVIFNYLIANSDYHLKNISLMSKEIKFGGGNLFNVLSPNYDSVNTRMYLKNDPELALTDGLLEGDFTLSYQALGFYSHEDFTELGKRIGIPRQVTYDFYEQIRKNKEKILGLIKQSFLSPPMKEEYENIFNDQYKKLFLNFH